MDEAGSKLLRGLLEVFLLESLEREPKHGYAVLKEMADAFGVEPNRNRLYPLLGRLVKEGLVHEVTEGDGGRTIYGLTEEGRTQLEAYRRLPRPFRDTLERVWRVPVAPRDPAPEGTPDGAPPASPPALHDAPRPVPVEGAPAAPATHPAPAAPDVRPSGAPPSPAQAARAIGASLPEARTAPAQPTPGAALPYPCPDARVALSKDPRTGDLGMTVTGCPMGAYEYCGKCPVFHAVDGLRRVVFSI